MEKDSPACKMIPSEMCAGYDQQYHKLAQRLLTSQALLWFIEEQSFSVFHLVTMAISIPVHCLFWEKSFMQHEGGNLQWF